MYIHVEINICIYNCIYIYIHNEVDRYVYIRILCILKVSFVYNICI